MVTRFKRTCVGSNGILECKILSKNRAPYHVPSVPISEAYSGHAKMAAYTSNDALFNSIACAFSVWTEFTVKVVREGIHPRGVLLVDTYAGFNRSNVV